MMPPLREDLVGFSDISTHEHYTLGQAEQKFGACIYRTGERPANLVPVFKESK